MSDDIDVLIRRKALELAKSHREKSLQQKKLTDEEAVRIVREITHGDRAGEIIEKALELYKPHIYVIFRKIAELHQQGVIKELADYELYELLKNAGFKIPIKTEIKIVRHGREYKIGGS